MNKCKCEA